VPRRQNAIEGGVVEGERHGRLMCPAGFAAARWFWVPPPKERGLSCARRTVGTRLMCRPFYKAPVVRQEWPFKIVETAGKLSDESLFAAPVFPHTKDLDHHFSLSKDVHFLGNVREHGRPGGTGHTRRVQPTFPPPCASLGKDTP